MKDERKHSTARRGGALNSKVQVTQKPCVSTKYTLPKRPSATLRSESESQPRSTGSRVPHSLAGSQHSGRIRHDFRGVCVSGLKHCCIVALHCRAAAHCFRNVLRVQRQLIPVLRSTKRVRMHLKGDFTIFYGRLRGCPGALSRVPHSSVVTLD